MEEVPEQHAQDAQMQDGEAIPAEEEEEKVELTEYEKKINEVKEMLGKSQKLHLNLNSSALIHCLSTK